MAKMASEVARGQKKEVVAVRYNVTFKTVENACKRFAAAER